MRPFFVPSMSTHPLFSLELSGFARQVNPRTIWAYWAQGHEQMPEFPETGFRMFQVRLRTFYLYILYMQIPVATYGCHTFFCVLL